MGGVIPTVVEGSDQDKVDTRVRDVQDVGEFEGVATCDMELNFTNPNSVDGRAGEAFYGMVVYSLSLYAGIKIAERALLLFMVAALSDGKVWF